MFTNLTLLSLAILSPTTVRDPSFYRPKIELWTNKGDAAVYTRGDRVRLYFRLDQDAYVTIFRVDTDGRVRVLFPRDPWEDNFARGGRDLEVDGNALRSEAFMIDDYPGVGYLFAVASADPFVYDQIESGDHWDYRVIADGRVKGDPYVAMTDLAQRIVPDGYADWDYDVISYNVNQHYDYPRFLCYDCHSYVSYSYWDPYDYSCVRFRIFVYDDPWYYPYRYYGDTRVVFVRPYRPQPRYIFKDWGTERPSRESFVSRERERPVNDNGRRGVTGRDLSGMGIAAPPSVRDRRDPTVRTGDAGSTVNSTGGTDRRGTDDRGQVRRDGADRPIDNRGGRRQPDTSKPADRPMDLEPREQPQRDQPRVIERRDEPRQVEPRNQSQNEPRRVEPRNEPRQVEPRNEPRNQPREVEQRRGEPRNEPRSQPQRAEPRNEPRSQPAPRAEPQHESPKTRNEPEVRRRKP